MEIEVGDSLEVNLTLQDLDPFQQLRLRNFRSLLDLAGEPIETFVKVASRLKSDHTLFELCNRFTDRGTMLSEHVANCLAHGVTLRGPPKLDALVNSLIDLLPVLLPPSDRKVSGGRNTTGRIGSWRR
jgi:hypothetical protein